jgi:hypothetical protein
MNELARVGQDQSTAMTPSTDTSSSSMSALDFVAGACNAQSSMSCSMQRGVTLGLTALGAFAGLSISGWFWALVGAVVGNVVGRKINEGSPSTMATCLDTAGRQKIITQILTGAVSQDEAEKIARSYEISGCKDDASAIRTAAKVAASGDLVAHTPPAGSMGSLAVAPGGAAHPAGGGIGTFEPSKGASTYVLTDADVAMRPDGFALRAGYPSVDAFVTDQEGALKLDVAAGADYASDYSIYSTSSPLNPDVKLFYSVRPWASGTAVHTMVPIVDLSKVVRAPGAATPIAAFGVGA